MDIKTVVFSGVNFTEGGPLSIIKDATNFFLQDYSNQFNLIILVHKKELFKEYEDNSAVTLLEYPWAKSNYLFRLYFEWVICLALSKKIKPFLWFALHDITPNVKTIKQVVYCHNPSPFYKIRFKQVLLDKKFFLHTLFYNFFYSIRIKRNDYVVVQQNWIKKAFEKKYKITNVIVAHPNFNLPNYNFKKKEIKSNEFTFFYPAFPRVFKNFDTLFQACELLLEQNKNFKLVVTINGEENKYATLLRKKYGHIQQIKFEGLLSRFNVLQTMYNCDCLIFPSELETWGLPLTEARYLNKLILVADLPYAHETLEGYDKSCFFDPADSQKLSVLMNDMALGKKPNRSNNTEPAMPYEFMKNWEELFNYILHN